MSTNTTYQPVEMPSRFIRSEFPLDGKMVPIRIKRLTLDEALKLQTEYNAFQVMPGEQAPTREERAKVRGDKLRYCAEKIALHVTVPEGALVDPDTDNKPIVSGPDFVAALGAREDVLLGVFMLLLWENTLSTTEKKTSQWGLGSVLGWPEWIHKPSGEELERIATAVALSGSLASEAALPTSSASSSAAAPSSADPAPSEP